MQRVPLTVLGARQTSSLIRGSCVLLLYLVIATPLAPALTTLLAVFDRSHHVAVQQTEKGLQVVLRHGCLTWPMHRHGMLARALTVLARRTTAPQSDHVIQFGAMDSSQQAPALAIEPTSNSPEPGGNVVCEFAFHAADVTAGFATFPRPPPAPSGLLLTVRSTVLVI